MRSGPLAGKPGDVVLLPAIRVFLQHSTQSIKIPLGVLLGENLPWRAKPGTPKVPQIIHQFAILCCILQHDHMDYILEKNLPI